ncbi:MAG: ABC transporter permease [Phycisphaeraceae bacterium]|nr:ABC transporter permease [Phycisphaeraceae bacterium]
MHAMDQPAKPMTRIAPGRGISRRDLAELWRHRHLVWMFALRDVKVRYKQTVVGAAWAVIQPLLTMVVFTVLFQWLGRVPVREGVPYPVWTFAALLPWKLVESSIHQATESLVAQQALITKVYFPRAVAPLAPILSSLMDFGISLVVLILLMAWYGVTPTWSLAMAPAMVLLAVLTAAGWGLWLAALNGLYRDIRYAVPFALQIGMLVSPVVYDTQVVVPPKWQLVYALNPMVGVLDGFRWSLLGGQPPIDSMLISLVLALLVLITGAMYFRRVERTIADKV